MDARTFLACPVPLGQRQRTMDLLTQARPTHAPTWKSSTAQSTQQGPGLADLGEQAMLWPKRSLAQAELGAQTALRSQATRGRHSLRVLPPPSSSQTPPARSAACRCGMCTGRSHRHTHEVNRGATLGTCNNSAIHLQSTPPAPHNHNTCRLRVLARLGEIAVGRGGGQG